MPQIQLFQGEHDGDVIKITIDRPDIFYAVPSEAEEKIKAAIGAKAKLDLRQKLSTMAYKFDKVINRTGIGLEYQYVRSPELDLPLKPEEV